MEIPRHWRLKKQRYSLVGKACPNCDEKLFPPPKICSNCGAYLGVIQNIVEIPNDFLEKNDITIYEQTSGAGR
jgi:uncharacterized OB-fold protein